MKLICIGILIFWLTALFIIDLSDSNKQLGCTPILLGITLLIVLMYVIIH